MRTLLFAPLLLLALPDIAPNPRNRTGLAVGPRGTTEVAMRSEVVELVLHEDHAEVRATFEMENTADGNEDLEVGFPTEAFPVDLPVDASEAPMRGQEARIYAFTASIDGKAIPSERTEVDPEDGRRVHRHWVCWTMHFDGKQKRTVEVRYEVETRDEHYVRPFSPLEPRELIYVLKTGAGWKGVIGSARILLRCADDMDFARVETTTPMPTKKGEREWEWRLRDFEPTEDVVIRYRVHADAAVAIARREKAVGERPADQLLQFDFAQNFEAVGRHAEAAKRFARLAESIAAGKRAWESLSARTREVPVSLRAARALAAANEREEALAWATRASADLEQLEAAAIRERAHAGELVGFLPPGIWDIGGGPFVTKAREIERLEQAMLRVEALAGVRAELDRLRASLER